MVDVLEYLVSCDTGYGNYCIYENIELAVHDHIGYECQSWRNEDNVCKEIKHHIQGSGFMLLEVLNKPGV